MAGSQLTQLKTALSSAGLNRKNTSKKDKKAFKKGGARETDRAKTLAKLEDIRKNLNKFDVRETKVKHDVGGRNLKGVTGRPSASKQAGLEQRRKTLLPEHQTRGHTGTFRDRRFGAQDPNMSIEDVMLERYTRERQKGQGKRGMFNLEDEDDLAGFDEGDEGALGLTHGGRSVSDLPGDDFEMQGLGDDDEEEYDEDEREGRIHRRVVGKGHFGGFDEEEEPDRKKTKSEVMAEIIAKSKDHKVERQKQKDLDDDLRDALDDDLDDLRELLATGPKPDRSAPPALPGPSRIKDDKVDSEYDQFVRTLAYEARAKPTDRTKTEDELAIEEAEQLQKAEAKRLRRMRGEDISDEEEEDGGYKKRRKVEKRGEADDLDDDFLEDDLLGPGLTREAIENMAQRQKSVGSDEGSGDEDEDEAEDDDDEEDEDEDEDQDDDDDDDDDEDEDDDAVSAMEDLDSDVDDNASDASETEPVVKSTRKRKQVASKEIPFTFPCPSTIEQFEDILEDLDDLALPIVVQRIRAIHHPSLAAGNKEKLQEFLGVLLDYMLILASRSSPSFDLISTLTPHLVALVKLNPITAASHFVSKITLMQKNLTRGLGKGATRPESKTYPQAPELVLLRLVGVIWSTSDYSNPVVMPAVLLMGQYLAQSRVRSTADLASGLFLCSILAQYESMSRRLLPEAINLIASSLLILLPRRKDAQTPQFPDIVAPEVNLKLSSASPSEPVDLGRALTHETTDEIKADLVLVTLRLVTTYATMYSSTPAFIEIFTPVLVAVEGSRVAKQSDAIKNHHASTVATLTRMLGFAKASRMPLTLQSHKPIPIASYAPRFEDDFAPGRHYDPDAERNASQKIKALYKKEKKGAIRELRKDNRFLAGEKAKEQAEKDRNYTAKMRRVEGEINLERAEEKEMQREKIREKRRAGRG